MTIWREKTRYQIISFLHELLSFFISSFLLFPLHVRRIILCFIYSGEHISLQEDSLHSAYVVDVDPVSSFQHIEKNEICIQILPESHPPYNREGESCYQSIKPHIQPTTVQSMIKDKLFKPLKLPSHLHPYPIDFFEYFPSFSGGNHVAAERHLETFENFLDQFEIVYDDVIMRLFAKSLLKDANLWFNNLGSNSIGSWIELSKIFLKYWGKNKSYDQYLADLNALSRGEEENLIVFNRRFYSFYLSMPLEIRPSEAAAMVYYVMAQHPELVFLLRERKSTSLQQLFEDAEEVEENIQACKMIQDQSYLENLHTYERQDCQCISDFEQEDIEYVSDLKSDSSVLSDFPMDRYACQIDDQFSKHEITNDHIGNFIFLADHYQCDLNPVLSPYFDHYFEERTITTDDQNLIIKEKEGSQFLNKEIVMDMQLIVVDQYVADFSFKDPVAAYMESYVSDLMKISDFSNSPVLRGECDSRKKFLSMLSFFYYFLLSSVLDEIISVIKMLEWLLWKSTFT